MVITMAISSGERNFIFCCKGTTNPFFQQTKIIIKLISHILFFLLLIFFSFDLFLLGYNKIDKKQKLSATDIVESRSNGTWSLLYITLMIYIFSFLDMPTLKPLLTARTTKNQAAFASWINCGTFPRKIQVGSK